MTRKQRILFYIAYTLNWSLITFIASSFIIYLVGILFKIDFKELSNAFNFLIISITTIILAITITIIQRNDVLERAKAIEKDYDSRTYWIIDFFILN